MIEGRARPKGSMSRGRYGGLHDRPLVRQWVQDASTQLAKAFKRSGLPRFEAPCNVMVGFYMQPAKTSGLILADLDKLIRGVFDAVTRADVWKDDVLVKNVNAYKLTPYDGQGERVELTINIPSAI